LLGRRPPSGDFALVEHIWHLADLEREGYGRRLRALLAEDAPTLPDFDGARWAREGRYLERSPGEGLAAFAAARADNLVLLLGATDADLARAGIQEGVGRVTLADLPRMMLAHDRGHLLEIADVLELVAPQHAALPRLRHLGAGGMSSSSKAA